MKILKVLLIVLIVFALLLGAAAAYFLINAKGLVLSQMEKHLGVPVTASSFKIAWPLGVRIMDMGVGENIKVRQVDIIPGFSGLLTVGRIFDKIVLLEPSLKVERLDKDTFSFGLPVLPKRELKREAPFYARRVIVKSGTIEFLDKTLEAGPFSVFLRQVNGEASQASLVQWARVRFRVTGVLGTAARDTIGTLTGDGWVDWMAKSADAFLSLHDAQLVDLGPYYKPFLKKDLKSGQAQVTATVKSVDNVLTADCHIELTDVAFRDESQSGDLTQREEFDYKDLTSMAFNSILTSEGKAVFDFAVTTKFDDPKFENFKIKGTFLRSTFQKIVTQSVSASSSAESVESFEQVGKDFEAIGKQFKKIFK